MNCPQCRNSVASKSLWILSGKDGSSCPHCKTSLCPRASCAVVLFLLSCVLGDVTLTVLRHIGAPFWLAFAAFFVVFAATYMIGAPLILRLRVRPTPPSTMDATSTKA
jgi:hypothetical protein